MIYKRVKVNTICEGNQTRITFETDECIDINSKSFSECNELLFRQKNFI